MPMLKDPSQKYQRFEFASYLPDRTWPTRRDRLDTPPRWLSSDLRDGNQALINPMSVEQKTRFFNTLVKCGFKEIEAGFPTASETEYAFVRNLAEGKIYVPDDVAIQVLTQNREDLIRQTFNCVRGVKKAIFSTYNASCRLFRDVVFKASKEETIALAVKNVKIVRQLVDEATLEGCQTEWQLMYTPEVFCLTEPDFAVELCAAVWEVWFEGKDPSKEPKIIFNLPSTVEASVPTDWADQVEYFSRNIPHRDTVCVSLHCHNDRGTAVASTELGLMAGAQRVEGCLFGNGERCGNVDLVTLALNFYTQGISPNLDFSDMQDIIKVVSDCTQLPVHPRHPYAGELVHCAFSGSHQDAIKKGFARREAEKMEIWEMPYLPIDPADVGCSYEAVIRVNSQSGKGGAAFTVLRALNVDMPKKMHTHFYWVVQPIADARGKEIAQDGIVEIFRKTYYYGKDFQGRFVLDECKPTSNTSKARFQATIIDQTNGLKTHVRGSGQTFLDAVMQACNAHFARPDGKLSSGEYSHHPMPDGSTTAFIEIKHKAGNSVWGVGHGKDVEEATASAAVSGLNALQKMGSITAPVCEPFVPITTTTRPTKINGMAMPKGVSGLPALDGRGVSGIVTTLDGEPVPVEPRW